MCSEGKRVGLCVVVVLGVGLSMVRSQSRWLTVMPPLLSSFSLLNPFSLPTPSMAAQWVTEWGQLTTEQGGGPYTPTHPHPRACMQVSVSESTTSSSCQLHQWCQRQVQRGSTDINQNISVFKYSHITLCISHWCEPNWGKKIHADIKPNWAGRALTAIKQKHMRSASVGEQFIKFKPFPEGWN